MKQTFVYHFIHTTLFILPSTYFFSDWSCIEFTYISRLLLWGQCTSVQSVFTQIKTRGAFNHLEASAPFPVTAVSAQGVCHSQISQWSEGYSTWMNVVDSWCMWMSSSVRVLLLYIIYIYTMYNKGPSNRCEEETVIDKDECERMVLSSHVHFSRNGGIMVCFSLRGKQRTAMHPGWIVFLSHVPST